MTTFWKNKQVFITGCSGFLGSWLTEFLVKSGATVVGLIRDSLPTSHFFELKLHEKINIVYGSLEDYTLIERSINENEIDTVFHLGAQTQVRVGNHSPLSTFESNIKGAWNVLEACRTNKTFVKRVVVSSSAQAYGPQESLPYTEEAPLCGTHPYDVSKSCTDLIAFTHYNTYDLPVVIPRCGNIFGPGDPHVNRLIPGTIRSVLQNDPILIRSDGTLKRDYMYVKDAVNAYITIAEGLEPLNLAGEAFNFSSGYPISVLEMIQLILKIMGKPDYPVQVLNESVGEIKDQYLSNTKAEKILDWKVGNRMEDALRETIEWYNNYFSK